MTENVTVTDATGILPFLSVTQFLYNLLGVGFATIQIDSEQMVVSDKLANALNAYRGNNLTMPAAHTNGAAVNLAFDQRDAVWVHFPYGAKE